MAEPRIEWLTEDAAEIHYAEPKVPDALADWTVLCVIFLSAASLILFVRLLQLVPATNGVNQGNVPLLLMLAAFAGLGSYNLHAPQPLKFDRTTRRLAGKARGGFLFSSDVNVGFDQLERPAVHLSQHQTEGDVFVIRLIYAEGRAIRLGASENRDEVNARRNRVTIKAWAKRIDDLIATRLVE